MKLFHAVFVVAALCVSGCDTIHVKQYCIASVAPDSADASRVKSVLQQVADEAGLKEATVDLSATNTLISYRNSEGGGVTTLSAWYYHEDVVVGLFGGFGTPPAYRQSKKSLPEALSREFGSRFSIPDHTIQIR
jgi:hypothetical protein